eukprot:6197983-Prymnesium_polylepis.1
MPEVREWANEALHLSMCVPHSIRRSGVKWASECMAYEWQCLIQGRWGKNSICFRVHSGGGFGVVNARRADVCANAERLCPRKRSRLPANR